MAVKPSETETFVNSSAAAVSNKEAPVSKWQSFLTFIYNSKEGTVLGRTGKSWCQIFVFYLIFYGILAAFFAVLLVLFLQTLDPNQPKWTGKSGLIGDIPGLGFRPTPPETGSTLIWLKTQPGAPDENVQQYINNLNATLQPYDWGMQSQTTNYVECNGQGPSKADDVCRFNLGQLGPCQLANDFGYTTGQPCVLIKLNKIFGWTPEAYGSTADIPTEVQTFHQQNSLNIPLRNDVIYVTCTGVDNVDKEHIGPLAVYPDNVGGFSYHYYPYTNRRGYLQPIVMVQFLNPTPGVIVNVECKAWAKNIQHSRINRLGQVQFELKVDR